MQSLNIVMASRNKNTGEFWDEIIAGGLRLTNRDIFRQKFVNSEGQAIVSDPQIFRRLTASENLLAEMMADYEKSVIFGPYCGHQADFIEKSLSSTFGLYPFQEAPEKSLIVSEIRSWPQASADWFLRALALGQGAVLAGVAPLDLRFLYTRTLDGRPIIISGQQEADALCLAPEATKILVLAFLQDTKIMGMNEKLTSFKPEKWLSFSEQLAMVASLAHFMRGEGFYAFAALGGLFMNAWVGALAGLGEVGRQSLLISPEYGPNVRLFTILTDWPLLNDQPATFGVTDYCNTCQRCINDCPAKAIPSGPQELAPNGLWQWPLNQKACLDHFLDKNEICRKCIEVCPYTREPLVR